MLLSTPYGIPVFYITKYTPTKESQYANGVLYEVGFNYSAVESRLKELRANSNGEIYTMSHANIK